MVLQIRPVADEDCRLLWEWANDPSVRALSFQPSSIPWEEHVAWFGRKTADPNCHLYIVTDEAKHPVGQVRFDIQPDGSAETSISISKECRNRGYGTEALRLACHAFYQAVQVTRIVAYCKPQNLASIRVFEKAGFVPRGRELVKGHEATCMSLSLARQKLGTST